MGNSFETVQVRRGGRVLKEIQRPVRLLDGIRAVRYRRHYWPLDSDNFIDIANDPLYCQVDAFAPRRDECLVTGRDGHLIHDRREWTAEDSDGRQITLETDGVPEFIMSRAGTRLHNCLQRCISTRTLPFKTLEEYLSLDIEDRIRRLLRIPNLGRRTALEFDRLVIEFSLESSKVDSPLADTLSQQCLPVPTSTYSNRKDESRFSEDPLCVLSERQKLVLSRRYGFNGNKEQTLEVIGGHLNVTRERVRQIEKQAILKLRKPAFQRGLQKYLEVNQSEIEAQVLDTRMQSLTPELSGLPRLAAEVVYGSVHGFFQAKFPSWEGIFFPARIHLTDVRRAHEWLVDTDRNWSAPISVETICKDFGIEKSALFVAVAASKNYREFREFIVEGYLGARRKRLINILSIARSDELGNPFDLWHLKQIYREKFSSDKCSGRDLRLTLENCPNYFVNLRELGWLTLGCPGRIFSLPLRNKARSDSSQVQDLSAEEPINNSDGLVNLVFRMIQEHGPLRLSDLRRLFQARHPDYSDASVLPTLVTFPIFVRLAPGVIGVRSHLNDSGAISRARKELLRPVDLDLFLYARISGSPNLRYPVWDSVMEHTWANWLLEIGDELRLETLLSQVEIDSWLIPEKERLWWRHRAARSVSALRRPPDPDLLNREIGDKELELVLLAAALEGTTHWMHSNQALGWRVDTGRSALALALASLAGWLKPPDSWWEGHHLTPAGSQVVKEIMRARNLNGDILSLAERILDMRPGLKKTGWLLTEDAHALLGCLERGSRVFEICGDSLLSDYEEELDIDALYDQLRRKDILSEEE